MIEQFPEPLTPDKLNYEAWENAPIREGEAIMAGDPRLDGGTPQNLLEEKMIELSDIDIDEMFEILHNIYGDEIDNMSIGEALEKAKEHKERAFELDSYFQNSFNWREYSKQQKSIEEIPTDPKEINELIEAIQNEIEGIKNLKKYTL